jgi:hypothetical protein
MALENRAGCFRFLIRDRDRASGLQLTLACVDALAGGGPVGGGLYALGGRDTWLVRTGVDGALRGADTSFNDSFGLRAPCR